jgi:hypothetical protein
VVIGKPNREAHVPTRRTFIKSVVLGRFLPWDGVRGPCATTFAGRGVVAYRDAARTDYIDLVGTMTAMLTARIDNAEHQRRILAMEAVGALGIHDPDFVKTYGAQKAVYKVLRAKAAWAVLSFRVVQPDDAGLAAAEAATGVRLLGSRRSSGFTGGVRKSPTPTTCASYWWRPSKRRPPTWPEPRRCCGTTTGHGQ